MKFSDVKTLVTGVGVLNRGFASRLGDLIIALAQLILVIPNAELSGSF